MIYRKTCIFILGIILLNPCFLYAEDDIFDKEDIISDEPIEIKSDRMDAFNEEKLVTFSGNAVVKQGDRLLKADELRLYYKEEPKKQTKKDKTPFLGSGQMDKIQAKGSVLSTQGERTVTGDEAVYYHNSGQIIITGNVVMREGNNIIKGCKAIIYLKENRGKMEECEPGKNQRVQATIYPQEIKKKEVN